MKPFEYINVQSVRQAWELVQSDPTGTVLMAGGMDLLGEMKDRIREPRRVVNLKSIPGLRYIKADEKGLRIGALTTLAEVAGHAVVMKTYTALSQAAASVGSPQIRNVGTVGGNLCQRPRCWYYRTAEFRCIKRGGTECFAVKGDNRYHALLGGGPDFIVHPSDLAPALIALNAQVTLSGRRTRTLPLEAFFVGPQKNPMVENVLEPGEVVTEVFVPAPPEGLRSLYWKEKEKESMDFALSSVAVALEMRGDVCRSARIVLGGVAPVPWRVPKAEALLKGKRIDAALAERAGEVAVEGAMPLSGNGYKVPLTRAIVKRAILTAVGEKIA